SPNKFKEIMELTVTDKKVTVTSVYNGKEAWIRAGDMDVKVTDDILAEFKEATHGMAIMQGMFVKDKDVKFTLVGEIKVKGQPAVGVTVSKKGNKDINVYFDKKT